MEDLFITILNLISIPRITNELCQKLYESLPIKPIWMDCNCGRFFNSNFPAKSLKLLALIWMDSSDLQFNMWNDFDTSYPILFFLFVNELIPILIVFNRFNPWILNVSTDSKQLFPISIDSTWVNREKSNIEYAVSLQVKSGMIIEDMHESIDWMKS